MGSNAPSCPTGVICFQLPSWGLMLTAALMGTYAHSCPRGAVCQNSCPHRGLMLIAAHIRVLCSQLPHRVLCSLLPSSGSYANSCPHQGLMLIAARIGVLCSLLPSSGSYANSCPHRGLMLTAALMGSYAHSCPHRGLMLIAAPVGCPNGVLQSCAGLASSNQGIKPQNQPPTLPPNKRAQEVQPLVRFNNKVVACTQVAAPS
eukprot:6712692-Karenia_brevis.AAC.1